MNFQDLQRYARQSVEALVTPNHYLHRNGLESDQFDKTQPRTNFQDQVSNILLDTISANSGEQYILEGMASEGKTTELRRLASTLQEKLESPQKGKSSRAVVHLLSMQNYSGFGANISTVNDLWRLLNSCHEARNIANRKMSFEEFFETHNEANYRPILLIDTLDMLSYARPDEDAENVKALWAALVQRISEHKATVVWSVRPHEFEIQDLKESLGLETFHLPSINWDEAHKLAMSFVKAFKGATKPSKDFVVFIGLLVVQYPILSKYLATEGGRVGSLRPSLFKNIETMYLDFAESPAYRMAHPLDWVMKKSNMIRSADMVTYEAPLGNFVVDELYKLSRLEILDAMQNILHLTKEEVEDIWYNHIELKLYDEIDFQESDFTNRLWLPSALERDNDHTSQIYQYMMMLGSDQNDGYGLFSIDANHRVAFQHQLFAEYAVYRGALSENLDNVQATSARHIPSCRLRMRAYQLGEDLNDNKVEQFLKWFRPFFTINRELQSLQDHDPQRIESPEWDRAREYALEYKKHIDQATGDERTDEYGISEDKKHILGMHQHSNEPLSINGPAGTGKSYIANPFILRFEDRLKETGSLFYDEKPLVRFVTLSHDLASGFKQEHDRFMNGRETTATVVASSVDDLLWELTEVTSGKRFARKQDFSRSILTENKFAAILSNDADFAKYFGRTSVHSLWHELLESILDDGGDEIGLNAYVDGTASRIESQFEGNKDKRSRFYKILQRLDLVNPQIWKTRRKIAGDIIRVLTEVLVNGDDANKANRLMEKLKPFRSELLIVDEVQDLGNAILMLCFMLHNGKPSDVAILGDREQTLELHQFDWAGVFQKIGASLYKLAGNAAKSSLGDQLGLHKWDHHQGGADLSNSVKDRLRSFDEVHRNVPPIVDLMKWSFAESAKTPNIAEYFSIEDGGTAFIKTSKKRSEEYEAWKYAYEKDSKSQSEGATFPLGVFYLGDVKGEPTKISFEKLIALIESVSYSEEPVEVILPDEFHRLMVADRLKEAGIQQTVWDPVSIKGLENKTIIVVSPWSIHKQRLDMFVGSSPSDTWVELVSRVAPRKLDEFIKVVEQRRRHANVMLSRPRDTLFILTLDSNNDDDVSLWDTTEPDFSSIIQTPNIANIMAEIDTLEELEKTIAGPEADPGALKDPKRHMELLEKLIQQGRGLNQIGIKALQVYQIAAELRENDAEKYEFMFSKFNFINGYTEKFNHAENNATLGVNYIRELLFHNDYRCNDWAKRKNSTISGKQIAFAKWQNKFYKTSFGFVYSCVNGQKLTYTTHAYDDLVGVFNEFITEFSGFGSDPNYQNFKVIEDYVFNEIFGGRIDTDASSVWYERARKMNLRAMKMVHSVHGNGGQVTRMDRLLELMLLFKPEHYEFESNLAASDSNHWAKILQERGYDYESRQRDQRTKLVPYRNEDLLNRPNDAVAAEEQPSAFWTEGLRYLEFNEFTEGQIRSLSERFFRLLRDNTQPAEQTPWVDDQVRWLLHLLVRCIQGPMALEVGLESLLDIEAYAEVLDLSDPSFALDRLIPPELGKRIWDILYTNSGRIHRNWSKSIRMNRFGMYSVLHEYLPVFDVNKFRRKNNVFTVESFYQTAGFLDSIDDDSEIDQGVMDDVNMKLRNMVPFIDEEAFVCLSSLKTNSNTIRKFFNQPATGLIRQRMGEMFANLNDSKRRRFLQHVLGVYISFHQVPRGSPKFSLKELIKDSRRMGLLPDTTVEQFIDSMLAEDKQALGKVINALYPQHSTEEREGVPYYPIHVDASCMDTPTALYDVEGNIQPEQVKNERIDWLKESIGYGFEHNLMTLNDVEHNAIYTLGLREFCSQIVYLEKAPNRFGNLEELWKDKSRLGEKIIHQQYVRHFLGMYVGDEHFNFKWLNSNYEIIDQRDLPANIRIYLGDLYGGNIQLELARYLQIERFSRFLRAHVSDMPHFNGRSLHQTEEKEYNQLFKIKSLLRHLVDAWMSLSEAKDSFGINTILGAFWDNIRVAVPPNLDSNLPKSLDDLFAESPYNSTYKQILGNKDEYHGFYGAARKLLTMLGGQTESFGRSMIKAYEENEPAPQSGTIGDGDIGFTVPPVRQIIAVSQIMKEFNAIEYNQSIAALNHASKKGEIRWHHGFNSFPSAVEIEVKQGPDEEES